MTTTQTTWQERYRELVRLKALEQGYENLYKFIEQELEKARQEGRDELLSQVRTLKDKLENL